MMLKGSSAFWPPLAGVAEPGLGGRLVSRAGLSWGDWWRFRCGVRVSLLLSISVSLYHPAPPDDL